MPDNRELIDNFRGCLQEAQTAVSALRDELDNEAQTLREQELPDLPALIERKVASLRTLEGFEHLRQTMLAQAGFSADGAGMRAFLREQGDENLTNAWRDFVKGLGYLQAINEANGRIINRRLQQTQTSLSVLLGQGGDGQSTTYDASGTISQKHSRLNPGTSA